jgi:hypothetical protein
MDRNGQRWRTVVECRKRSSGSGRFLSGICPVRTPGRSKNRPPLPVEHSFGPHTARKLHGINSLHFGNVNESVTSNP